MPKTSADAKLMKDLSGQLKALQDQLIVANKLEGKDDYITVKTKKNQARFERVKVEGEKDKAFGNFFMEVDITTKAETAFIPLSIASSKKPTGFMYLIEGTGEGSVTSAEVSVRGERITQVTIGTLLYGKIPPATTARFRIKATIRGKLGKTYKITINRINYKLTLTDARYQQYLKPLSSDDIKLS